MTEPFVARHIGIDHDDQMAMSRAIGFESVDALIDAVVPESIRTREPLAVPSARSEDEVLVALQDCADANMALISMLGMGYANTITPAVLRRNVLENPAWYTSYTPYQPEISQGRLEALLNFQTMVTELTGFELANASLLDEATAAAEAMTMLARLAPDAGNVFVVDVECYPQTIDVIRTRAVPLGIDVQVLDIEGPLPQGTFGALCQYVGVNGRVRPLGPIAAHVHATGAHLGVAADLLHLVLLEAPGHCGADVAIGSTQRFGVPLAFGGPHAAYIATTERAKRVLPGRLVGVSVDAEGNRALRLTLQTREQHIRREKATSNICTAQALLAIIAGLYATYHGASGLQAIAQQVVGTAAAIARTLDENGVTVCTDAGFDTLLVATPGQAREVCAVARTSGINLRQVDDDHVALTCDETTTPEIATTVVRAFGVSESVERIAALVATQASLLPQAARRTTPILTHPVFSRYRSETEMMRYLRRLADRDLALDRSMIPLGSCTMKLNSAVEMEPISWPGFAQIHPFAPSDQTAGYRNLITELESWLCDITGYDAVSLQPNSGAQGEYAGLLAIRAYHQARGDGQRNICLIPSSAHGTNAASAVMAGMDVVVLECDSQGNVDIDDCKQKAYQYADRLAALMVTYPSTHGVFETNVRELCAVIHEAGGQVYLDGANLNALVGLAKPGHFGADVSHLNLHKTFCIPHGGGGPGVGPIGVREHLAPYLPNHPVVADAGPLSGVGAVAAAPWGSAGILPISWAYIALMGPDGLLSATKAAIVAANYIVHRVHEAFPILYRGERGLVAHECILDLRDITARTGVTVDDVAKRLMDFGFHAPTMSWPVAGTLMVEPTESESRFELDRFCDALLAIRFEIGEIESGAVRYEDSALQHAPHTAHCVLREEWDQVYSRAQAATPVAGSGPDKYWPPVARIDAAFGDRNLVCTCPPVSDYAQ